MPSPTDREQTLREQIVAALRDRVRVQNAEKTWTVDDDFDAGYRGLADAALSVLSSAPITDAEVEAVAKAVRRNHFVRTRRTVFDETVPPTENELDDARAAIAADRKWMGDQK